MLPLDGSVVPTPQEVGGKAHSIARMRAMGLPVPPAVVLPVADCRTFRAHGLTDALWTSARDGVTLLEAATGRTFGRGPRPLLLSVRSGAAVSMPGMMDTVLDLGMNDEVEAALGAESGDVDYAADTHRRFREAYRRVILRSEFDDDDRVPADPWRQLREAIAAVFASWDSRRAKAYRRHWRIADDGGTAVTLQAMVFGNLDARSGTGVLFTRDPLSGERRCYGEYLPGGQGEDVVAGDVDPLSLDELATQLPDVHRDLVEAGRMLEQTARDAQDIEFTVEQGRLFLLQSRTAKRSPGAALRMTVDLVDEGVIDPSEAVRRVTGDQARAVLRARIAPEVRDAATVLARGHPACPGVAQGLAVAGSQAAEDRAADGTAVILVAPTTSPEDVSGMVAAVGACTETGGATSHAAVVSRALGRPSVVGCGQDTVTGLDGREITVCGDTGEVLDGLVPLLEVSVDDEPALARFAGWAADEAAVSVVTPADAPDEVVDLDVAEVVDPEHIASAVRPGDAVAGHVLATDAGVRAAVAAGAATLVVDQPLAALLAAVGPG